MNQLSRIPAARAQELPRDTFEAWRQNGEPLETSGANTLEEAINLAAPFVKHKDHFFIQHNRADARRFLHVYYVPKSTKKGVWRESYDGGPKVFEGFCEVKELFATQIDAPFSPVAPYQWSQDDPTGAKHGICADLARPVVIDGGVS